MKIKMNKTIEEEIELDLPAFRKKSFFLGDTYYKIGSPKCITVYTDMIICTDIKHSNINDILRDYNHEVITEEEFNQAIDNTVNYIKSQI